MQKDFVVKVKCKPAAGEIFNKRHIKSLSLNLKSSHQSDDFTQCHYDSFGQGPKRRGGSRPFQKVVCVVLLLLQGGGADFNQDPC